MDSIEFRGGVAIVKRLRIRTIALCLRTGAPTVEYFRAHGFYEWLAISTGSYWSSEELRTLLEDLDRYECKPSQAQMNTDRYSQLVSEKVAALHELARPSMSTLRAYMHAGCDQSITAAARFLYLASSIDVYARDNESQ